MRITSLSAGGGRYTCNGQEVTRDEYLALYEQYKEQCKQDQYDREERSHILDFRTGNTKAYERILRWLNEGHEVTATNAHETIMGWGWYEELKKWLGEGYDYKVVRHDRWEGFPSIVHIVKK